MLKNIIIIGSGDLAREVLMLIKRINSTMHEDVWNVLGFCSSVYNEDESIFIDGIPLIGDDTFLDTYKEPIYAVCAIATPEIKKNILNRIELNNNISFPVLIDPQAIIADDAIINSGSIVFANSIISINCRIGKHVLINFGCSIGHDVQIGDYCSLYVHGVIAGHVKIGSGTEVGSGVTVLQGVEIGEKSVLGMGSVVLKNIPSLSTVIGNPARVIARKNDN